MSQEGKEAFKVVRQMAMIAERKVKEGRKLYRAIEGSNEFMESLILSNWIVR